MKSKITLVVRVLFGLIFLVHAFMAPEGLPLAIILGAMLVYLAFFAEPYAPIIKGIFRCPMCEKMKAKKAFKSDK